MKTVLAIGIGPGDPSQVTMQAVDAIGRTDVFFVVDKPGDADELGALRRELCDRYAGERYRIVHIPDPQRERDADDHVRAVAEWRSARAREWRAAIDRELPDESTGAFLVWGDPALYDGAIDVLSGLAHDGVIGFEIVPGISSVQLLAARHGVTLNRVGGAVLVTTGRLLREGFPHDADDVVVMLDAGCAFTSVIDEPLDIYWGAYLGMPDEILIAGPLAEKAEEIARVREHARARKGWIFDVYLLRRR